MRKNIILALALAVTIVLAVVIVGASAQAEPLTPQEQLGKFLFFDTNLSDPPGQACAACHGPQVGYTGPDEAINAGGAVYEGAVTGDRQPQAACRCLCRRQPDPSLERDEMGGWHVLGWSGYRLDPRRPTG